MTGGIGSLDVRYPIGALFTVLGVIVAGYGFLTRADTAMYERSTAVNINLLWGVVMLGFGIVLLLLARRHSAARARQTPAAGS